MGRGGRSGQRGIAKMGMLASTGRSEMSANVNCLFLIFLPGASFITRINLLQLLYSFNCKECNNDYEFVEP